MTPILLRKLPVLLVALLLTVTAEAADFTLPGLQGQSIRLADYRGQWVVVNFWATWCPPCLEEMPVLDEFYRQHRDSDVTVIGVNYEPLAAADIAAFIDRQFLGLDFPIAMTGGESVSGFGVRVLPTTFFIDPEGGLASRHTGTLTVDLLASKLQGLRENQQ